MVCCNLMPREKASAAGGIRPTTLPIFSSTLTTMSISRSNSHISSLSLAEAYCLADAFHHSIGDSIGTLCAAGENVIDVRFVP